MSRLAYGNQQFISDGLYRLLLDRLQNENKSFSQTIMGSGTLIQISLSLSLGLTCTIERTKYLREVAEF
jgi:hypothetical protein